MSDKKVIGKRYRVERELAGREQIVYEAFDTGRLKRHVALMAPNETVLNDPERLEAYIEKNRNFSGIKGENVIKIIDFIEQGVWDERCYLITEWMDQSLTRLLQDPIQPNAALDILKKTLLGVQAIHAADFVHCTLNPDSIFLSSDFSQVKIGDLGIGAEVGGDPEIPDLRLTPKYMAPEIFRPDLPVVKSADVYSCGMIAYEMLLGRDRFEAEFATIYAAEDERQQAERWASWHRDVGYEATPLNQVDASIPEQISAIVARMMSKDLEERYADATEILSELTQAGVIIIDTGAGASDASDSSGDSGAGRRFNFGWLATWKGMTLITVVVLLVLGGIFANSVIQQNKLKNAVAAAIAEMKTARALAIEKGVEEEDPPLDAWMRATELLAQARPHNAAKKYDKALPLLKEAAQSFRTAVSDLEALVEARADAARRYADGLAALEPARQQAMVAGADDPPLPSFETAERLYHNAVAKGDDPRLYQVIDKIVDDMQKARDQYAGAARQADTRLATVEAGLERAWDDLESARLAAIEAGVGDPPVPAFEDAEVARLEAEALEAGGNPVAVFDDLVAYIEDATFGYEQALSQVPPWPPEAGKPPLLVTVKGNCDFEIGSRYSAKRSSAPKHAKPDKDEDRHTVCVEDFVISAHEVTVAQYRAFTDATGRDLRADPECNDADCPAIFVSWRDAKAYAAWIAAATRQSFRLPTEAEWEYAARGGKDKLRFWGDDPDAACTYANVFDRDTAQQRSHTGPKHECEDNYSSAAPVGIFEANGYGLYDMLGNVWEWTCSGYDENFDGAELGCFDEGDYRYVTIRGGSWQSPPREIRSSERYYVNPDGKSLDLGFRLARD